MGFSDVAAAVGLVANVATAAGVLLMLRQMRESREQGITSFEDALSREYRDLARDIPVSALLGESLSDKELETHLIVLFRYIDLSNEQVFLRQQDRVRQRTWENWRDGIKSNLERPAFREAWTRIKAKAPGCFRELRSLEASDFQNDPVVPRRGC